MTQRFLILHGFENRRPPGHWHHWLAERLRGAGEQVLYPQLPEPDTPRLESWAELLRAELGMLGAGERVVVCHSLSCLLWMHYARRMDPSERVDRVLLVAPPGPSAMPPEMATFLPEKLSADAIRASCRTPIKLACSDDDPWCPEGAAAYYGEALGLDVKLLPGHGHLSETDGLGPWPWVEEWCRGGS